MPRETFQDVEFHLELEEPAPPEVQAWAKEHLGEGDDKDIKIYELREMIFERGDVVAHRTDDPYLLKFLRARSFNVQSAYKLLVNYYTFKENNPELHENLNPLELRFIGDKDMIQVLPYREQTGRRIMIYKLGNWDPSEYPVVDMFKATLAILELGCLEPRAQILGGNCIFDFQNISLSHAWQITPSVANKVVELMVSSFPLKVHAVHIVYESRIFDVIYNIFKPLLNNKMKEKIFFHGSDMESLHNHIDPKYLPKSYGGIRPNYRYNRWIEGFRRDPRILKGTSKEPTAIEVSLRLNATTPHRMETRDFLYHSVTLIKIKKSKSIFKPVEEIRSLGYVIHQEFLDKKYTNSDDEKRDSDSDTE